MKEFRRSELAKANSVISFELMKKFRRSELAKAIERAWKAILRIRAPSGKFEAHWSQLYP